MKRLLLLVALLAANVAQAAGPCFWGPGPTSVCGSIVATAITIGGAPVVVGPVSSTDNAVARFDGTAGAIQNSSTVTIGDTGALGFTGSGQATFLDDAANPINTKIAISRFDPGDYQGVVGWVLPSTAGTKAWLLGLWDGRTSTSHIPTINVTSPNSFEAIGMGWVGDSSAGTIDSSVDIAFRIGPLFPTVAYVDKLHLYASGAVGFSGAVGSTGQVLTSRGPTSAPVWAAASGASGATGSVQFATGGALSSDNANFFWDDTANRLGLGDVTPDAKLDVQGGADELELRVTGNGTQTGDLVRVESSAAAPYVTVGPDGDVRFSENGSVGLFWDASTHRLSVNAGDAPFAALQVDGTGYFSGLVYVSDLQAAGSGDFVIGADTASDVVLKSNGTVEGLRVASNKAVTIADTGGNGGNVLTHYERSEGADSGNTTCEDTCAAGTKVIGGGCHSTSGVALVNSYPSSDLIWHCDYLATTANCKATAICAAY